MNLLHIYGQGFWNDEVFIYGTIESLTSLRDTLNVAINNELGWMLAETKDGGEYQVTVKQVDEAMMNKLKIPPRKSNDD